MKVIGFNLDKTHYGLPLDNGGACLIIDGEVKMMISEERLNRKQYSSGYEQSIRYILENCNLKIEDIDLFVASSCLEPKRDSEYVSNSLKNHGFNIPSSKIDVINHHLAHACSAYYPSGFDSSIIMVLDGDGNTLNENMDEGTENEKNFWKNKNEHNSYYLANGNNIDLIEKDEIEAGENGFGGAYRYFTYFCGFHGYRFAGKLMGLSAYGSKRNKLKDLKLFDLLPDGKIKCLLPDTDRLHSPAVVENWLKERGVNIKAGVPGEPITEDIEDVALFVQRELDRALIYKVKYLIEKTGIYNLCIAGGVGLNAVSNRAILDNTGIKNIFIQPAAGDSGQCLGDALYGAVKIDSGNITRKPISVYLGKEYSEQEILSALDNVKHRITFKKLKFQELTKIVAQKISENYIISWFQGRSEIGPRALGNRSILANPTDKNMKDLLNSRVKHREAFRPFAPSVLEEKAYEWFDITIPAPYMIMNAEVKQPEKIPSVTHLDGSARLQTVNKAQNERYYDLIKDFEKITNVPILINTSFNDNEAIVESPSDALNTFLKTSIDYLIISDYFIEKNLQHEWEGIASKAPGIQKEKNAVLNQILIDLVNKYQNGKALFDYGSGLGEFANLMQQENNIVSAFDHSDEMITQAKKTFDQPTFLYKKDFDLMFNELKGKFDIVTSNLVLCISNKEQQDKMLEEMKSLMKDDGKIVLSFCHPKYDFLPESIVSERIIPPKAAYDQEFLYEKIIKENNIRFHDYHRPMEYYENLFTEHGLKILETKDSDTLSTSYKPDFLIIVLSK